MGFLGALLLAFTLTIKMTPDGFDPANSTVQAGSTVTFLNEDTKDRWPASNPHPIHDLYSQFDPKQAVKPGGSWSFQPQKAGTWKYHDHLNPHLRATLVVQGKAEAIFFDRIKNFFVNFWQKFTAALTNKQPLEKLSWAKVKESYKGQPGSAGNVHDLAHLAGGMIFDEYGMKGLSKCSSEFAFGCYHGFLDKAFKDSLNKINEAESACGTLGSGGPYASCVHGIGHGVASFYQTSDLKASLLSCKRLSPSGWQFCFDGVFMEFERSAPVAFYSKERPYQPCDGLGEEFAFSCGRNQPTVWIDRFKYSFDEIIQACLGSPSEQFKLACFDAVGFNISKGTSDPSQIVALCRKIAADEYMLRCAKAASGELIFQDVPGWQESSPAVCNMLPANFGADCHNYIQNLRREYAR